MSDVARVLFLVHRLPYPPNKGDKIHSFHVLQHLSSRHDVLLGTFVDHPSDEPHVQQVRELCLEVHVSRVERSRAILARSAFGWLAGEPLTQRFYRNEDMARWVRGVRRAQRADVVLVYSSTMVQYAQGFDVPTLMDFGDIDSAKWAEIGRNRAWPVSALYAHEARLLARVERRAAMRATASFFATEVEAEQFRQAVPEAADRVEVLGNGVDAAYFEPAADRPSPFAPDECALVFTGAMNYWPNVDAVLWFAREVLPQVRSRWPRARLHVVGRHPEAAVRALESAAVHVTGEVADVRPYLQHAALCVAPLRIQRGLPNKVLEGMAMQRAVVTSRESARSVRATAGVDLVCANTVAEYVQAIVELLGDRPRVARLGEAGRAFVLREHTWDRALSVLDARVAAAVEQRQARGGFPLRPDLSVGGAS